MTLATAFAGAWLVLLIDNPQQTRQRLAALVALLALFAAGALLHQTDFTRPDGTQASVALPQGNIPQNLKWEESQIEANIRRYFDLVGQSRADIVILPETALTVMLQQLPPEIINAFARQAETNGSALAVGVARFTDDGENYENAVINLSGYQPAQGYDMPYYAKDHLVPFGEYKPLAFITEPLYQMMNMPLADFNAAAPTKRRWRWPTKKSPSIFAMKTALATN